MADSFFGFDASVSNLNDDEGGGGDGSEEEYDALNDETFGQADSYDWESAHEHLANQLESTRRSKHSFDGDHDHLEASISQLVLDDTGAHSSTLNSSNVWQHDAPFGYVPAPQPKLKNVLSVEEVERQLRQKQLQQQQQSQQMNNFFQPRFPAVILQRPPGLQAGAPPPYTHAPHNPHSPHNPNMGLNRDGGPPGNQMGMNRMGYYPQQQSNQLVNGAPFGYLPPRLPPPPGLPPPRAPFQHNQMPFNPNFRPPTKMDQPPQMNQNMFNHQQMHQQQMQQQQMHPQQQINQTSPKNVQKMNQQQKTRVTYNSNQKNQNLTSQNLVQLIQNTHPMLQFNNMNNMNSYHNANHHPMLNRNGGFNPPINPMMVLQRQPNGNFSNNNNNRLISNGSPPRGDSYAGLMSSREKQWLLNIQLLQLNTGTPYVDDFYYTVFLERQSRKEKEGIKEAHKANQQNHPFYSGNKQEGMHRERHNSARHNSQSEDVPPRTYVPTQFENSLGRLQCGSVTAPRKIIDVEVVQNEGVEPSRAPSRASTANPSEYPREVRRTKQLLLDIEALYLILLRLEELNEPLAISNALILKEREEKQKLIDAAQKEMETLEADTNVFLRNIEAVHRKSKTGSPKTDVDKRQVVNLTITQNPTLTAKNLLDENKDELIARMFAGLLHEDRLQQFMMVRKGKSLVSRFLRRVPGAHGRLRAVWSRVLRCVAPAARRDDGSLTQLAPRYHEYIQAGVGWPAILESCSLLAEAFDPARTPYALTAPFTMSCICSLIEKVTTLINTPEATPNERQWTKFLKTFARALKNTNLNVAKPVNPLSENKLLYHIKQIESRSVIEILQRGRTTAEYDLSKSEFSELLLRHLC